MYSGASFWSSNLCLWLAYNQVDSHEIAAEKARGRKRSSRFGDVPDLQCTPQGQQSETAKKKYTSETTRSAAQNSGRFFYKREKYDDDWPNKRRSL